MEETKNSVVRGPYELQILNDAGQPLPIINFHGKPCARSQCGTTYKIKVIVHRDSAGAFPASHLIIVPKLDGKSVGYNHQLELSSAIFKEANQASYLYKGFCYNNDDICAFVFNPVIYTEGGAAEQNEVGTISITIYAAEPTTEALVFTPVKAPLLQVEINKDKKFWQAPSAVTVVGEKVGTYNCAATKWKRLEPSLAELTLYYHTPEMFDFLKYFQERFPLVQILPGVAFWST